MPYRCRIKDCRKPLSVRTGTVMESSKLGFQVWAIAIYLMTTNLNGISSTKLHRELSITQRSAWFLAHRLRKTWADDGAPFPFAGPVEVDESHVGEKAKSMHARRKREIGIGDNPLANKTTVAGMLQHGYVGVFHPMSREHLRVSQKLHRSRKGHGLRIFAIRKRGWLHLPRHDTPGPIRHRAARSGGRLAVYACA